MTPPLAEFGALWWFQEPPQGIPQEPPPLPGGVTAAVRWLFQVPQWIQMAGGVVLVVGAVLAGWFLWRRRAALWDWLSSRALAVQAGIALLAAAVIVAFASGATVSWNYMQNDNDFCTACHVMDSAFQRFTDSEHAQLLCHDCHQQSIFASIRQLHLWVVDRPEEIGEHAPVPTATCTECHQTGRDSTWQRVLATTGHRTHLESDSSALASVMCVTCHGQEVHRFVPATQTCGQADCHAEEDTRIVLGAMADQTSFHCITCHAFTDPVQPEAPLDSALVGLTPTHAECLSCHEMSALLESFDAGTEPHGGVCGDCHNPHVQETPEAAIASCTGGGCHAAADTLTPFHEGLGPARLEDCLSCHVAHTWRVEGSACLDCHADVLGAPASRSGQRTATPRFAQAAPSFEHFPHADLGCGECHTSERAHGEVTIRTQQQCASCHHTRTADDTCGSCHGSSQLAALGPRAVEFSTMIAGASARRSLDFRHEDHRNTSCGACHDPADGPGGTLGPVPSCASCHQEHHQPEAACSACHTEAPGADAHELSVHADATCAGSGCHAREGELGDYVPANSPREACLSCHVDLSDHEAREACAYCHLIPEPRRPAAGR